MKIRISFVALVIVAAAAQLFFGPQELNPGVNSAKPPKISQSKPAHQTGGQEASGVTGSSPAVVASGPSIPTGPVVYAQKVGNQVVLNGKVYPLRTYRTMALPNDPSANQPWVSTANVSTAWDVPRGNNPTLLAVVDTGFALGHQEFQNRWYSNSGEQGAAVSQAPSMLNCTDRGLALDQSCNLIDDDGDGIVDNETGATTGQNPSRLNCSAQGRTLAKDCNNLDDDGNGYVDDVRGWDFAHNDNSVQDGESAPSKPGGRHGTYVTGVAAATGNNGVGIAGVDWGTTILPLQALGEDGTGYNSDVANAILYAASKHADVISLSLGSSSSDALVREAVQRAIAGNDGCDCMVYPANYPEVVAVGAAANNGQPASFSSYGANLDIIAPGVNLFTTTWLPANGTSAYAGNISGTSLATPIVSGLLARLKSLRPTATPLELLAALTENTNRLTLPSGVVRSNSLGFGLADGGQATQRLVTPYAPAQRYIFTPISFGRGLSQPAEVSSSTVAYKCENSRPGSTPVYELLKAGSSLFSASTSEVQQAIASGYSASFLSYLCLSEPHDQPDTLVRSINLYKEFRDISGLN
jgi:hypothetical protein